MTCWLKQPLLSDSNPEMHLSGGVGLHAWTRDQVKFGVFIRRLFSDAEH